jgi:hypothetical protein
VTVLCHILAAFRNLGVGLLVALLPSPERDRLARSHYLDAPRWSLEIGLLQGLAGVSLFIMGGLAFMRPAATDQSMILFEDWFPGLSPTHFQGLGIINWFAWFLYPVSWPLIYLALVGLARCTAFAVTREAVAEPVVWISLRTVQTIRARSTARANLARLGPDRPDRLVPGAANEIVVVTCRKKPDWTPAATVALGDRYYKVEAVEECPDGEWNALAYRLREQHESVIIRRYVEYNPPTA